MKITKKQFLAAYNKYPANNWVKFGYKYFSKSTKPEDAYVKKWSTIILVVLFLLLMIGGLFNLPMSIMIYPIIIYSVLIVGIVTYMFSVVLINNKRVKKIANELGISIKEYSDLVKKFMI